MLRIPLRDRLLGITWSHPEYFQATPEIVALLQGKPILDTYRRRSTTCTISWLHPEQRCGVVEDADPSMTVCGLLTPGCLLDHANDGRPVEGDPISRASLRVYWKDRFEREEGRKRSLKRALIFTGFTRSEREVIWDAYFARPRIITTRPGTQAPQLQSANRRRHRHTLTASSACQGEPV